MFKTKIINFSRGEIRFQRNIQAISIFLNGLLSGETANAFFEFVNIIAGNFNPVYFALSVFNTAFMNLNSFSQNTKMGTHFLHFVQQMAGHNDSFTLTCNLFNQIAYLGNSLWVESVGGFV